MRARRDCGIILGGATRQRPEQSLLSSARRSFRSLLENAAARRAKGDAPVPARRRISTNLGLARAFVIEIEDPLRIPRQHVGPLVGPRTSVPSRATRTPTPADSCIPNSDPQTYCRRA